MVDKPRKRPGRKKAQKAQKQMGFFASCAFSWPYFCVLSHRFLCIVDYRRKFPDSLVRGGEEEANQAETHYEQAKAQTDKDYEETSAAVAAKTQLSTEGEAELTRLWKKLVKLYHPDRFAHQPDELETYEKQRMRRTGNASRTAR